MQRRLVREVLPEYPAIARQRHIHGIVTMEIRVSTEGRVTAARTISGHALLIEAALDAVRQWIYRPVVIGGAATEVISIATVSFQPVTTDGRKGRTILHPALLETPLFRLQAWGQDEAATIKPTQVAPGSSSESLK
jgi:TonB family protein